MSLGVLMGATTLCGCYPKRIDPFEQDVLRNKVSVGMTPTHVTNAWDEPCDKKRFATAEGQTELWWYCMVCPAVLAFKEPLKERTCKQQRLVLFGTDGKVIEVQEEPKANAQPQ
jgi:hypothetical protein